MPSIFAMRRKRSINCLQSLFDFWWQLILNLLIANQHFVLFQTPVRNRFRWRERILEIPFPFSHLHEPKSTDWRLHSDQSSTQGNQSHDRINNWAQQIRRILLFLCQTKWHLSMHLLINHSQSNGRFFRPIPLHPTKFLAEKIVWIFLLLRGQISSKLCKLWLKCKEKAEPWRTKTTRRWYQMEVSLNFICFFLSIDWR